MTCSFTAECFDQEVCADADYHMSLRYTLKPVSPSGLMSKAVKSDMSTDTQGVLARRAGVTTFTAGEFYEGQQEHLFVAASGEARFIVVMGKVPLVITYHGSCKVEE